MASGGTLYSVPTLDLSSPHGCRERSSLLTVGSNHSYYDHLTGNHPSILHNAAYASRSYWWWRHESSQYIRQM